MKRKKWTRSEKILWLMPPFFLLAVGAMIYAPHISRPLEAFVENRGGRTSEMKQRSSCISNLNKLSLAMLLYSQDYDERFPPATIQTADYGWGGLILPYMRKTEILHCPKDSSRRSTQVASSGFTNYYYNARLSGGSSDVIDPARIVLFGEGVSSDARYAKTELPAEWKKEGLSPARVHYALGSAVKANANYAFADGHVLWHEPQNILTTSPHLGRWTFALR
ncbi:DUF1559 domain-containing protein [bacterium]|nr:MAG: DUF1559 domain-containing protein [bacterium]